MPTKGTPGLGEPLVLSSEAAALGAAPLSHAAGRVEPPGAASFSTAPSSEPATSATTLSEVSIASRSTNAYPPLPSRLASYEPSSPRQSAFRFSLGRALRGSTFTGSPRSPPLQRGAAGTVPHAERSRRRLAPNRTAERKRAATPTPNVSTSTRFQRGELLSHRRRENPAHVTPPPVLPLDVATLPPPQSTAPVSAPTESHGRNAAHPRPPAHLCGDRRCRTHRRRASHVQKDGVARHLHRTTVQNQA